MKDIKTKNMNRNIMNSKTYIAIAIFLIAMVCIPGIASAMTHPCLLFENISETPGYQYRTESPWSSWEAGIIALAGSALSRDFTDPNSRMSNQAEAARNLALAYQITKDTTYADKAKDALLNLDIGDAPYKVDKAWAALWYSFTYDWTQPYLNLTDDEIIRDKLATFADEAYYDLNDGGTNLEYISSVDYHLQAYPAMGVAGCVLFDYNNPNNLPLSSTPTDWVKVGTEYLFENDLLHSYNKPMIDWGFDGEGVTLFGGYKSYPLEEFIWWFQVYSHFNNSNIFEDYPLSKKIMTSELWESMPNRYHNNYCTGGNYRRSYHRGVMGLFDNDYKAYMLNHDDIIESVDYLGSEASYESDMYKKLMYLTYVDYSDIQRKNPLWTSHFDPDSFFQVFRGGWENDSDWLSFITWNHSGYSNRYMAHHDQLSFEYYSRGDLLLADGGENKYVLDKYYGEYGVFHNTILIEDPRNPFDVSSFSDSTARGIYKGNANGLTTSANIEDSIQTSWMDLLGANATIGNVIGNSWSSKQPLTSPIQYKRTIIYPEEDYFIVIDRLEGGEPWVYRNVFRPSSLNITPSTGITEGEVGHVNGILTVGGTPYDWLSLNYKSETPTGINTKSIKWNTTNPYGNDVELHLFSVPSSEIRVTKHVTRIAGTGMKSEVFMPLVYFRTGGPANDLYRVTVLLPRYSNEAEKNPEEVPVTGNGNAVKVTSGTTTDLIYAGSGESSFGGLTTDADILHLRESGAQDSAFTFLRGSYVDDGVTRKVDISKQIDYLTLKYDGDNRTFTVKGVGTADITLHQMNPSATYQVKRDGVTYTNWVMTDGNSKMVITTDLSGHTFEIESTALDTTSPVITNVATTNITSTTATIEWDTNEPADSLIKYGTSPRNYTFKKHDTSLLSSHTITLTNLLADAPYYFVVNSTDYSGNSTQSCEYTFNTTTAKGIPETTVIVTPAPNEKGWITATPVTITFFRSGDFGIAYTNYSMASQEGLWTTVNTSAAMGPDAENVTDISEGGFNATVAGEGTTEIWYYSVDTNTTPNVEPVKNVTVKIDHTSPAISNVTVTIKSTIITWETNELADSLVKYGTSSGIYTESASSQSYIKSHSITLTGLTANTAYYYVVNSTDPYGNSNQSSEHNFTTTAADATPPIISNVTASGVISSSATITWTTNENSNTNVTYATNPAYLGAVWSNKSEMVTAHSDTLTGLSANTTYYYRVYSTDAAGNTGDSGIYSFITLTETEYNKINVAVTSTAIVVDGILDEWTGVEGVSFKDESGRGDPSVDNTATVKAMWDNNNLYFVFNITDTNLQATGMSEADALHLDDSIEIYIDTEHNGGTAMQVDDYHFIINLNNAIVDDQGTGSGKNYSWDSNIVSATKLYGTQGDDTDTDTGYVIEVSIPWTDIGGAPTSGSIMGLDLAVNDRDDVADGLQYFDWCNISSWAYPDDWGDATFIGDATPPETIITSGPDGTISYSDISFNWTGSDDVTPTSQLVYSYKLENYDSGWSSWASAASKSYYDLPNGNYTFKVKAKDEAGNEDIIPANRSFTVSVDTTPPASISDLQNTSGTTWIKWTWTNPTDTDFNHTMVYLNGIFKTNTSNAYYNATGLVANTSYEIGTHTVDTYGNVNTSWVNQTTKPAAAADASLPLVTNPSATPDVIPDDTDNDPGWGETAQLNVTVTDDSGILNVTINLSQIGGSSVQPMTNIGGNIWSVTTNASNGTAGWNGTAYEPYHLQVNATDIHGNSNTPVSIELMVMKNGDVTGDGTVDFGDGIRLTNHDNYPEDPKYSIPGDTIADVTGDGIVDFGDGIRLINHDLYPEDPRYILK